MEDLLKTPMFGITAGAQEAARKAARFGADYVDLHFEGDESRLIRAMQECDTQGTAYQPNFEGAPLGWLPSEELRGLLAVGMGAARQYGVDLAVDVDY